jgi:hypothetical protein
MSELSKTVNIGEFVKIVSTALIVFGAIFFYTERTRYQLSNPTSDEILGSVVYKLDRISGQVFLIARNQELPVTRK